MTANKALAKLVGSGTQLPNQSILLNSIVLRKEYNECAEEWIDRLPFYHALWNDEVHVKNTEIRCSNNEMNFCKSTMFISSAEMLSSIIEW